MKKENLLSRRQLEDSFYEFRNSSYRRVNPTEMIRMSDLLPLVNDIPAFKCSCKETLNRYFKDSNQLEAIEIDDLKSGLGFMGNQIAKDIVIGNRIIIVLPNEHFASIATHLISYLTGHLEINFGYKKPLKDIKLTTYNCENAMSKENFTKNNIYFCNSYIDGLVDKIGHLPVSMYFIDITSLFHVCAFKRDFNTIDHDIHTTLVISRTNEEGKYVSKNYLRPLYTRYREKLKNVTNILELINRMVLRNPNKVQENKLVQKFLDEDFIETDRKSKEYVVNRKKFLLDFTNI